MPQLDITLNLQLCVALYDNTADSQDELSFKAGEVLAVVEQEAPGLDGWWLCSLRGRKGICPRNRLKLLSDAEQAVFKDGKRKSWQQQQTSANKIVPQKGGEGYVYDMPQPSIQSEQMQYDVPPSQALPTHHMEESYDVPKPVVGAGSLTPSSSISSLTTDSNRSSLIQQDYDVPRPSRLIPPQGVYDIPRGGEIGLDMTSALEWLGRLESDVTGSISRLLSLATVGWRLKSKLEPRLVDLRSLVTKLSSSLHDLTIFTHSVYVKHHDSGLGQKLGPLVTALTKAELQIRECTHQLETIGWNISFLAVDDLENRNHDTLDVLVQCAAALTDDIRAIASFIQGNSTLLFKRSTPTCQSVSPEDVQYMNLTGQPITPQPNEGLVLSPNLPPEDEIDGIAHQREEIQPLSAGDRKVVELFAGLYWAQANCLAQAIEAFLNTVTQNQPPKAFLARCKAVVMSASCLLLLGESIERQLDDPEDKSSGLKNEAIACNKVMGEFLSALVVKTKTAAVQFPSVKAVQKMVDAVDELSKPSERFKHALFFAKLAHS